MTDPEKPDPPPRVHRAQRLVGWMFYRTDGGPDEKCMPVAFYRDPITGEWKAERRGEAARLLAEFFKAAEEETR